MKSIIEDGALKTKQDYLNHGLQSFANKDYERACLFFRKALECDKEFETAYRTICESLNRMNKIEEALSYAIQWITINSQNPQAHLTLSKLYAQIGDKQKAAQEMALYQKLRAKAK